MNGLNGSAPNTPPVGAGVAQLAANAPSMPLGNGPPAGDHRKLALVRLTMLGGMLLVLPPLLLLMSYQGAVLPVAGALVVLLGATALGFEMGRRTQDLRSAWLFYAVADTTVVIVMSVLLGQFLNVFLLAVVVELARI